MHKRLAVYHNPSDKSGCPKSRVIAIVMTACAVAVSELATSGAPARAQGQRGANLPWVEYEAEDGMIHGNVLGPSRSFGTFAAESSGRRSVKLAGTGDFVRIAAARRANSVVVRYAIPDAPMGGGMESSISLFVDGIFRRKLILTSRYTWSYGGEEGTAKDPTRGGAHHFFDEARALVGDIPAGGVVELRQEGDDRANYVIVDLIDLEQVSAPLAMPPGFISIESCGAVADDGIDDGPAIQACIREARLQKTGVWIPRGTFESTTAPIEVDNVWVRGAGMWYSTVHGLYARFNCVGNGCKYADFSILGETTTRIDASPENGFNGSGGEGSRLENIWVEHTKVGYWVGKGEHLTHHLVITGSRFRDLYADGVNFCNGTSFSSVTNSHFRNTGDDALASWSYGADPPNHGNIFHFNSVQLPWRANCFAIYGGHDNAIEDNYCADVVTYPGILIEQNFTSTPFAGHTLVLRNSLVRAGGPFFGQQHGALKLSAIEGPVSGVLVHELTIDDPTYSGVQIQGLFSVEARLSDINISNPGSSGINISSKSAGDIALARVVVSNADVEQGLRINAPATFKINRGSGNAGW